MRYRCCLLIGALLSFLLAQEPEQREPPAEHHLAGIHQLSHGGENAEAYFSADGKTLIFQATRPGDSCDQIYLMDVDGGNVRRISSGRGKTTCGYLFPDGARLLYSSTHQSSPDCPPLPDYSRGYVWAVYPDYDIYTADWDGDNLRPLAPAPGYDAEATISRDGQRIVFTSGRGGDLDLYTMNADGTGIRRVTSQLGYDGGAFFSPNGREIVYRSHQPATAAEREEYLDLRKRHLIRPTRLDLFLMRADGSRRRRLTQNGAANFAPSWHPDGEQIVFASNMENPAGRNFDLYLIRRDGSGLTRITYDETFDGFPIFSADGKKLVWASNRNAKVRGETNIFIADWIQNPVIGQ